MSIIYWQSTFLLRHSVDTQHPGLNKPTYAMHCTCTDVSTWLRSQELAGYVGERIGYLHASVRDAASVRCLPAGSTVDDRPGGDVPTLATNANSAQCVLTPVDHHQRPPDGVHRAGEAVRIVSDRAVHRESVVIAAELRQQLLVVRDNLDTFTCTDFTSGDRDARGCNDLRLLAPDRRSRRRNIVGPPGTCRQHPVRVPWQPTHGIHATGAGQREKLGPLPAQLHRQYR